MRRLIAVFLLLMILVSISGCPGDDDIHRTEFDFPEEKREIQIINLGNIPSETVIHRLQEYTPLIKILEEELNIDIQQKFSADYEGIINNMLKEEYDLALLAPLAYARYSTRAETPVYSPIVQPVRHGEEFYRGIIFTHKNNDIESLADLEGKRIAFVDKDSASGYLFPRARLLQEGIVPEEYFSEIQFLGRHDLVVRAVYTGDVDVGVTYDDARPGNIPPDANPDELLPILTKTAKIPTEPTVINKKFQEKYPNLCKQLIDLLVEMHETTEGQQALERLEVDKFIRTEDANYDVVRETVNILRQE